MKITLNDKNSNTMAFKKKETSDIDFNELTNEVNDEPSNDFIKVKRKVKNEETGKVEKVEINTPNQWFLEYDINPLLPAFQTEINIAVNGERTKPIMNPDQQDYQRMKDICKNLQPKKRLPFTHSDALILNQHFINMKKLYIKE